MIRTARYGLQSLGIVRGLRSSLSSTITSDSFEEGLFHAATRREAMNKRSGGEHQVAKSKGSG